MLFKEYNEHQDTCRCRWHNGILIRSSHPSTTASWSIMSNGIQAEVERWGEWTGRRESLFSGDQLMLVGLVYWCGLDRVARVDEVLKRSVSCLYLSTHRLTDWLLDWILSPSLSVYLSPAHPCSLSFSITLSPSFLLPLSPDIEWHWEWLANSVKLHWSSSTHKNNEEWPVLIYSITNLLHSRPGLK